MQLTERDKQMLEAIHFYDGMLADYQLRRLFFPTDTTGRYFKDRMSKLFHNRYVAKPGRKERN